MTPKQRYLFDLTGYLHLKNVLSEEELRNAQDAVERCVQTPPDQLPPGISYGGGGFSNGFSFDKSLEALTLHPKTWGIVKELTSNRPRFNRGSLVAKGPEHDQGYRQAALCPRRLRMADTTIRCQKWPYSQ